MPRLSLAKPALTALALLLGGGAYAQPTEPGIAGAYLAARAAVIEGNHQRAAEFFDRALDADPGNPRLVGNAIFANAAIGRWVRAAEIADTLSADAPGQELVSLVRLVGTMRDGDMAGARAAIEAGQGAGPLIDDLALGWIALGEGDMRRATERFEQIAADPSLAALAYMHLGFARAAVGDFEGAEAILSGEEFGQIGATERSVQARAHILLQLDRRDEALELLEFFTEAVPDPSLVAVLDRVRATETAAPYDFIITAQDGLAEVFFSVARILGAEGGASTLPLLYTQSAFAVDPTHADALLYAAQILYGDQQYDLAATAFARIPEASDQYIEAQLGRADALFDMGSEQVAVGVLADLAAARPELATVHAALGDMLRRTEQCDAAIDAYSDAIDLVDITQERYWFVFYTRAICYEHVGNWPPAEADFRYALELNPDQPSVLNYLGYSLVEQRRDLDEALDMIQRAVAGRPDSGYITDSLGWVFYRLGRFDEAVDPMERAVELEPNDPIINDHLGDVYWMVGRYREAEFQWHRALSFDPEPEDAARIRRKLDVGLYDVLEEEGGVGATQ
jgi:tetratricopeptide (TPR) repeat protein